MQTPALTSDTAAQEHELLLIGLGHKVFALPLQHVRYVARIEPDFAASSASGAGVADYFMFEGEPLSYVSLWDCLGIPSAYAGYHELQTMLPQRRQDHLDWMSALEISLRDQVPFTKARSPRECAFGKWYYSFHSNDRRLETLLGQFDHPHARIHGLADRLLGMSDTGQRAEALRLFDTARESTLAELLKLFDAAGKLVVELQRRVAIILEDGSHSCALGVDMIRTIVAVPPERVRVSGRRDSATTALIVLDDHSVVPLLNWRMFAGEFSPAAPLPAA